MSDVKLYSRAYIKMMLHATKYPYCAVNGILLAPKDSGKGKMLQIIDAIPLFHQCLHVTPMAEIALVQIEAVAQKEGLQIAGYYCAAENFNDNTMEKAPGIKIAEKINEYLPNACFVMIDNKEIGLIMDRPGLKIWQNTDGRWTKTNNYSLDQNDVTLEAVSSLVQKGAMRDLNDFDNYLDNSKMDWINSHLNRDLEQLLAMY